MKIVWSNGAKKALTKIDGRYHRRIVITLRGDPNNDCYVLAVKLREGANKSEM
ncbi:hypothetical protein WP5S18E01_10320 [Enterobacter cloacae]|nr:hypothetical protein WP5S18E01_10320 [Enterobacter cloacae]